MTNALAVLNTGALALSDIEQAILAEAATDTAAYDPIPTRLTISPGGTNIIMTSRRRGPQEPHRHHRHFSQKARVYWPEKGGGLPPLCSSPDALHGFVNAEPTAAQWAASGRCAPASPRTATCSIPVPSCRPHSACASCPLSRSLAARTRAGQAAGRRARPCGASWCWPTGGRNLRSSPCRPPASRAFDTYASSLARGRSAYFGVRTKITLDAQKSANGDPYSVAAFTTAGALTLEEVAAVLNVRRQFEALVRTMPIEGVEYDTAPVAQTGDPLDLSGNPIPFGDDPFEQGTLIDAPSQRKYT
jgi:hypothetical protein